MHPYSIESEERRSVFLILAGLSIVLSWAIYKTLVHYDVFLPWWIESPSILSIYGLLVFVYDKWAWRLSRKIGLSKIPDLRGEWTGHLRSSFDEHETAVIAKLTIFQTWTRMKVLLDSELSWSQSELASIALKTPEGKYLYYQFLNEPKANAPETMSMHRGTVKLLFDEKKKTLFGEYYSGRDRQNYGSLFFRRTEEEA